MNVLIVGGGGREHAIASAVAKSKQVDKIYCAPGNAGIAKIAECVPIGVMEFDRLADFAKSNDIDLAIIGPDDPLVGGIDDVFEEKGIRSFGPRKNAAILEGSKAFSKDLMKKYGIPTAAYENFDNPEDALKYLVTAKMPIVLKADGLALGKGVLICNTLEEAKEGINTIMVDKKFGNSGNTVVIEEFMTGREVSVLAFVDGKTIKTMSSSQDHKRAKDNDEGLTTIFVKSPFKHYFSYNSTLRVFVPSFAIPIKLKPIAPTTPNSIVKSLFPSFPRKIIRLFSKLPFILIFPPKVTFLYMQSLNVVP